MKKKVLVGMSGGVDSTVTAKLLLDAGYEVEGVYMRLHDKSGYHEENFEHVCEVAEYLGIKVSMIDLSKAFEEAVYIPFIEGYREGRTPNPCAVCNRFIKFGKMIEYADSIGADYLATGHYVRHDGTYLLEARDKSKDQSYFLFDIDKRIVPRLLFPLGEWLKEDVKACAADIEALSHFATKKESSEICFVETTYVDVLKEHMEIDLPGEVLDTEGNVIGHHKGYMHYTIGKRRGFFVKGAQVPHYVKEIRPETNQIVVTTQDTLLATKIFVEKINLMDAQRSFSCQVKIRYRTKPIPCRVEVDENGRGVISLQEPVYGVASGQAAVFYEGEKLLGGGWITGSE
ncbi:tRNA 2-thiouridine(34) synthase MnmA [Hydrogenimonas urashimensis]|uniref:tRNA 2-thiouridine(34) synthase MnmA n=1 Tax=Hydrogenimonas urashimensis TaxID=2740515 RepID=UPI0019167B71|nr:tRNA 2-thiouridine(34) synthase MnmA [Hydrogenimonas urashimensis]